MYEWNRNYEIWFLEDPEHNRIFRCPFLKHKDSFEISGELKDAEGTFTILVKWDHRTGWYWVELNVMEVFYDELSAKRIRHESKLFSRSVQKYGDAMDMATRLYLDWFKGGREDL